MDREDLKWLLPTSDRAQQAGMFLGSAAVPLTFQKTLMPRSTMDQAIVTGIVMALSHTIGALVQEGDRGMRPSACPAPSRTATR